MLGGPGDENDAPVSIVNRPAAGTNTAKGGPLAVTIRTCLAQLRVVSLERLVREVIRVKPDIGRTEVVAALEELIPEVRWFGRTIVAAAAKDEETRS